MKESLHHRIRPFCLIVSLAVLILHVSYDVQLRIVSFELRLFLFYNGNWNQKGGSIYMVNMDINNYRQADHPIEDFFLKRWSPRSFSDQNVEETTLFSVLEAARWAPSGSNKQPWRFILARTEEDREKYYSFINEGNLAWCKKAPVLVLIISDSEASGSHAFDAGTSWGYLALQAMHKGLVTHAMGGFDKEKAREVLNIPPQFALHAIIAVGYQDEKEKLAESYQEREKPSPRRPLKETVFEGEYKGET